MFALLAEVHRKSSADVLVFTGLFQGQAEHSESLFAQASPELMAKEKQKADNGYCETAFWNCTDLCEFLSALYSVLIDLKCLLLCTVL